MSKQDSSKSKLACSQAAMDVTSDTSKFVCVYEQDANVYLRLAGILENPDGVTGDHIKVFTINRDIRVTNSDGILVVRLSDLRGAPEYRFRTALLVIEPDVNPCRRSNECKQIIRYFEQAAFIDIGLEQTLQLQVCDFIAPAENNQVVFVSGALGCSCIPDDISGRLGAVKAKQLDENLTDYPTADLFLIHLRRDIVPPATKPAPQ